jgi:hypothetical protein
MLSAATVIAHVEACDDLVGFVGSLDAQSLPYAEFEVVFCVREADEELRAHLEQVATRRPNMALTTFGDDWPATVFASAREAASEWVLPVGPALQGPNAVLLPQALERLVAFGRAHECDVVVGRASATAADLPIPAVLLFDTPRVAREQFASVLGTPVRLYRTEFVRRHDLLPSADDAERLAQLSGRVGVLAASPVMRRSTVAEGAPRLPDAELSLRAASWRDGVLTFEVSVTGADAWVVALSIRHLETAEEYWLDTHAEAGSSVFSAALDVRVAAAGTPVPDGRWRCYVNTYDAGGAALARVALPAAEVEGAVVDGILVATTTAGGLLTLDVGGTKVSPLPTLSVDHVTITEDAAGTLLVAELPMVHVSGRCDHPGALRLGGLRLPAKLISAGHTARLECFVSGVASTNPLSYQVGSGPLKRTSLDLVIDEVGRISVVPSLEDPEKTGGAAGAKPAAPAAKSPNRRAKAARRKRRAREADRRAERALLTRIRRNLPPAVEPVIEKLAENPRLVKAYQALTGRGRTGVSRRRT